MKTNVSQLDFPGKRPNEHVLLLLRRHWSILLMHGVVCFVLLIIPLVIDTAISELYADFHSGSFYPLFTLVFWLYLMGIWTYFFVGWIDYYLDAWIVTNDRIINIEQNGLFNRVISEQRLYRIQDVTAEVKGPWKTMLNFGNVYIQTAGEMERFVFEDVPEPYQVKKILIELQDTAQEIEYERQAEIEAQENALHTTGEMLDTSQMRQPHNQLPEQPGDADDGRV